MKIEAELHDGTILEFPEGTPDDVIQRTVRRHLGLDKQAAAPAKPAATPAPAIPMEGGAAQPSRQLTDIEAAERPDTPFRDSALGRGIGALTGALQSAMGPRRQPGPAATTGLYETPTGRAPTPAQVEPVSAGEAFGATSIGRAAARASQRLRSIPEAIQTYRDVTTGRMPLSELGALLSQGAAAEPPRSVMADAVRDRQPTIGEIGGPASSQFVEETRRALEGMTPAQRQQVAQLPGMRGAVARQILEGWQQSDATAPASLRGGTQRVEDIALRREQQGASREVAEGMARVQNAFGVEPGALPQARESDFDFDARQQWKDAGALARGLEKGRVLVGEQFTGAARFISDVLGTDLVSERLGAEGDRMERYVAGIGDSKDFLVRNFENAVASTLSNLPALAFGVLTGSSVPALAAMGLQVFGEEYNTGRQKGLEASDATMRASVMGAAEIIGEQFGIGALLKGLRAAADGVATPQLARFFAQHMLREIPGEQLTTAIQFANDKFPQYGLQKQATFDDYLGQVADTLAATVMQGAMMTGGAMAGSAGIRRLRDGSAQYSPLPAQPPIPGALPLPADLAAAVADKPATRALLTTPVIQAEEGSPYAQPQGTVQGQQYVQPGALPQPAAPGPATAEPTAEIAESVSPVSPVSVESDAESVTTGDGTRAAPIVVTAPEHIEQAEQQVNTEPTDAQKEAGNYAKAHVQFQGFNVSIENPKGSERTGTAPDGTAWSVTMPATYGYIKRTEGADGDQVDVYLGDKPDAPNVFVVDQIDPATGKFDEHKALMGFPSIYAARQTYEAGFSDGKGKARLGAITAMPVEQFREWVRAGDTKAPVAYRPKAVDSESALTAANTANEPAKTLAELKAEAALAEPRELAQAALREWLKDHDFRNTGMTGDGIKFYGIGQPRSKNKLVVEMPRGTRHEFTQAQLMTLRPNAAPAGPETPPAPEPPAQPADQAPAEPQTPVAPPAEPAAEPTPEPEATDTPAPSPAPAVPAIAADVLTRLDGRKVDIEVEVGDAGKTARMTLDAGTTLRALDARIEALRKLRECVS